MSKSWLYVLGVMIAGSVILHIFPYLVMAFVVNIGIFVLSYLILRGDPYVDLRGSMLFILGLTVINLLAAMGWMSSMMSNIAFIALLVWSMMGGGSSR